MEEQTKKGFVLKDKKVIFSFLAGMLVMFILAGGIITSLNPSFLKGTVGGQPVPECYKMFPSKAVIPDATPTGEKFMGELSLLFDKGKLIIDSSLSLCDGRILPVNPNVAFFSLLGNNYGGNAMTSFGTPNYIGRSSDAQIRYYISKNGIYPPKGSSTETITKDDITYLKTPYSRSSNYLGELLLIKTDDDSKIADYFLPCQGQEVKARDYPFLADYLGAGTSGTFKLPDLTGLSPVSGAKYYMSTSGVFPNLIQDGYMQCKSCGQVVPQGSFCLNCGARQ